MAYSRSNAAREKEGEGKRIDMAKEACGGGLSFPVTGLYVGTRINNKELTFQDRG